MVLALVFFGTFRKIKSSALRHFLPAFRHGDRLNQLRAQRTTFSCLKCNIHNS